MFPWTFIWHGAAAAGGSSMLTTLAKIGIVVVASDLLLGGYFLYDYRHGSLIFPNSDFERGDLENWSSEGEAFSGQPVRTRQLEDRTSGLFADNWTDEDEAPPSDSRRDQGRRNLLFGRGRYFVGSYERTHRSPEGDAKVGVLRSIPFVVRGDRLFFRIGGGDGSADTSVQLVVEDERVLKQTSAGAITNVEAMSQIIWDVSRWRGKTAFLEITDLSTRPWGHINVDDFRIR